MEFCVLGPVGVLAGERALDLGSDRRRTLLAVLLAAGGGPVTTDALIDALWGADPPASARKSLQSHLSRLRGELAALEPGGAEALISDADGYRMELGAHDHDAEHLESLVAGARESMRHEPQRALALFEEARALWRGRAFGDLAAHPAVRAEAVRLEQLRAASDADRVDVELELGRHEAVVGDLEAMTDRDPLGERTHGQLMLALYRSGRQAEALATYRQLLERLRDEVGIDPSPPLRELHERILRQDPELAGPQGPRGVGLAWQRGEPGAAGRQAPTWTPAVGASALLGRDADVTSLATLVATSSLVTLTGPGGVGKTRLAERVAAEVSGKFPDGMAMCALATVREADTVGEAMVTALGIQPGGEHTARDTLVGALGHRRLLLVLDNCEHLLTALTPLVAAILASCPNVTILATSRERLHLPDERVWQVGPLAVPPPDADASEVAASPAGALFRERAEAVEPTSALTDASAPAVAELCRRLDGMPLAIELAAARVRAFTPQDLVARLDQRFSLLAAGPRHEAGRHRTLEAVVAWSYDLLEPAEAELFARLSVFAGSFTLEAAERVGSGRGLAEGEVAGLLGELVDKSMVIVDRAATSVRYRLLDTLRDFGARRLAEAGATEVHRRAHAAYHLAQVEALSPQVRGPDEAPAVAAIDAMIADLRVAHAWMLATGDSGPALRLPAALADYVLYRLRDEVTTWARRALELPGAVTDPDYPAALATAAMGATSRGECVRAAREGEAALALADDDSVAVAFALVALGTAALYEGRLGDLLRWAGELAELARRLDEPYYRAYAGVLRVLACHYHGDLEVALSHAPELHSAAATSGNPTMRAFAQYSHGEIHLDARPGEAEAALEQAVELAREVDNPLIEGVSLVSLASLRGRQGRTREALELFRQVVVHWRRLGDYTHQLTTLRNLVELLAQLGADEAAAVLHGGVTAGLAPSFGAEAERLDAAWSRIEERLGAQAATAAAARGRRLSATQMGDEALARLDALLEG